VAPPSQLVITMVPNSVSNTVVVPISSALQNLETSGSGLAADLAIRAIFRAGTFVDGTGRWWAAFQILSIVAS
jgi:hypothetical protein